VVRI